MYIFMRFILTKFTFRLLLLFLLLCKGSMAQENTTTVGIQYKPIFPLNFIGTGTETSTNNGVGFELGLKSGFCGGMVIRHGFTDLLGLEGGINYVKRKYKLAITDSSFTGKSSFQAIGYEIPLSMLVFIQLGEYLYMNASLGTSFDMFASSVQSTDTYFKNVVFRNRVIQSAVLANIGWEWRTEKSGYIYLGASYHRPFGFIYLADTEYIVNRTVKAETETKLLGNYLTLDLRYFFHEDPLKKQKKKK